jgi:hypothetical protein
MQPLIRKRLIIFLFGIRRDSNVAPGRVTSVLVHVTFCNIFGVTIGGDILLSQTRGLSACPHGLVTASAALKNVVRQSSSREARYDLDICSLEHVQIP